ncbi:MAG: FAD:protein FMN transferase [Flammeovirgaceae bacterium]|nr:FAD:protein FMN transferase [Flammeovirgaceae bacterium]
MSNRTKNIVYTGLLMLTVFAVWQYRRNQTQKPIKISGETMATTYHITYFDSKQRDFKASIDSLLKLVNASINTYDPTSEISVFNKTTSVVFALPYLLPPIKKSQEVVSQSNGTYDPTVMPLVNAWGFGPAKPFDPDSSQIDSLKQFVGFEKIQFNADSVWKTDRRAQLDFGGIGQGYGADVITDFLKSNGIENMFVELGGEGMACGINLESGKPWRIGILDPKSTDADQFFKAYINLKDKSFTTSGNYFNYRDVNGKKFSHTIDPEAGYPVMHELLSASVFTQDCATADAWGTAFMVMGHQKAIEILKQHPELDAILMYSGTDGVTEIYITPGIKSQVEIKP